MVGAVDRRLFAVRKAGRMHRQRRAVRQRARIGMRRLGAVLGDHEGAFRVQQRATVEEIDRPHISAS